MSPRWVRCRETYTMNPIPPWQVWASRWSRPRNRLQPCIGPPRHWQSTLSYRQVGPRSGMCLEVEASEVGFPRLRPWGIWHGTGTWGISWQAPRWWLRRVCARQTIVWARPLPPARQTVWGTLVLQPVGQVMYEKEQTRTADAILEWKI